MAEKNIELLIKYTRLANNNPNEAEANLAARRACKLLAELTEQFKQPINIGAPRINNPTDRNAYTPTQAQQDFWEKWKKNPYYKSRPKQEYYSKESQNFKFVTCTSCGKSFIALSPNETKCPRCAYEQWEPSKRPQSKAENKRPRQCIRCGHIKMTFRVTNLFICDECQWKEYEDSQNANNK